ncbi:uncharacterized protein H6S33_010154 [Morchella sextelata]|uniref:uncharacterized protein n=1 Tax=Morchella sextelata TaxID=1174677 RepID=UPI001D05A55E|nr:uncharacterized protein H6S33_010154 [Morchella sextelata]KAH0612102.1 hypothetical protein H6S33_010154 [Morchella sextelata]
MAAISQFPFPIPTITPEDLAAFDETHFSPTAHTHLTANFLPPPDPSAAAAPAEDEEDTLGYYPDGTKRTLTDTQISIFRHSEIQDLLRRKRHNRNRRRKFRERQAAQKAAEADEVRAQAAAEAAAANPVPQTEATEGQVRKGRLEAAIWASAMQWDEQEGGNQGKDQPPVEEPKVLGRVDRASGREFLWPAIER